MSDSFHRHFLTQLAGVAAELGKLPDEVTKTEFLKHCAFLDSDLRRYGGFASLKKLHVEPEDHHLEIKYGSRLVRNHANKRDKEYGQALFYERSLVSAVKDILSDQPLVVHPATRGVPKKTKAKRTIIAALSDTHYGTNIDRDEMHNLNEFNWTIAARRTAFYMDQIVQFKEQHRKDTSLILQINGDIIGGLIHNPEWFVDLLTEQFTGSLHLLTQAVSYLAQAFSEVKVVCTVGNHGRNTSKTEKGRSTTNKWDSFESMLYVSLREVLTQKHKNVSFDIPKSPFAIYPVQGHNVMQTHGDTVIRVGNPGKSINTASINNQLNVVNSAPFLDNKVKLLSVGHVHVATAQRLANGSSVLINGCLSGTDPYAQSIGIFDSHPIQIITESTEKYALGDVRMIYLSGADKDAKLDNIVKPFKGCFSKASNRGMMEEELYHQRR
jgi:hypothetical protein